MNKQKQQLTRYLAAIFAIAVLAACAGPGAQTGAAPAVVAALRGDVIVAVSGTGTVKPRRQANVSFAANGVVQSISVREGQMVRGGQTLAVLNDDDAVQQLNQAQANYDRTALQGGNLPPNATANDRQAAQASTRAALAQLNLARQSRAKITLHAPFGGMIVQVGVVVGEATGQRTAFVLADTERLFVEAAVGETEVVRLAPGQVVTIAFDALPSLSLPATITSIAPQATVQQNIVTYAVRAELTQRDPRVRLGMSANLEAVVDERRGVLVVPIEAVREENDGPFVIIERTNGETKTRSSSPVQTGLSDDINIEITGGLNEGDQVVIGE